MRYVDLGVTPSLSQEKKKKRKKKILLITGGIFLITLVAVIGYAFYWPILELLKNPDIALSFFNKEEAQLKSTDGRTNILLLGIDKRSNVPYTFLGPGGKQQHNGFLSDTIIVASYSHETKKISLVSITRDTWISIPSWEKFPATQGKINSAYSIGDVFNYPGGGIQLAKRVVGEHLGITIHYVGRIDFQGFEKTVNTLDGIDVVVEKTFDDYRYPVPGKESASCGNRNYNCRFEHLHFDKGSQHMDGKTALGFVRSRSGTNGEGSDFARARRQQKVIEAVIKRALSLENILNPITLNSLFREFGESVETDFDLVVIPQVIKLAKEFDLSEMKTFVLDPSSNLMIVPNSGQYGGAYVIVPKNNDWRPVKLKIKEFLTPVQENTQEKQK